jgi:hypothetical protein
VRVVVFCFVFFENRAEPTHIILKTPDARFQLLEELFVFGVTVRVLVRVLVIGRLSHDLNLLQGKASSGLSDASVYQSSQRMATLLEERVCQRRSK